MHLKKFFLLCFIAKLTTSSNLIKYIRTKGHEDLEEEFDRLEKSVIKKNAPRKALSVKRKLDVESLDSPNKTLDEHVAKSLIAEFGY